MTITSSIYNIFSAQVTETVEPSTPTLNDDATPIQNNSPTVAAIQMTDSQTVDQTDAGSSIQDGEEEEPICLQQQGKGGKHRNIYLTEEQKEEIIEFLMHNEGLHNKKNELWQQKARSMGVEWKDIFTWYETQRRRLGRLKTLANKSGSGSLEDTWKESDVEFWHRWQFLRPHINTQSQEPIVSLRQRLASATTSSLYQDDGSAQGTSGFEEQSVDLPDSGNCSGQIIAGRSTPVSSSTQLSRRSSQTQAANQIMDALAASNERHNQLVNLSESILKSQQETAGQHRDRHQFNLWCGSLLHQLPQGLYEQCETEMFRLMTHYRELAQKKRPCEWDAAVPPPSQQRKQPQRSSNQTGWQPCPSTWIQNPPTASSVWGSQDCDYMNQYNQTHQNQQQSSSCYLAHSASNPQYDDHVMMRCPPSTELVNIPTTDDDN